MEYHWYILAAWVHKMTHQWYSWCITQYTLYMQLNFTTGKSFCWPVLLECINYAPQRWPFKGWNMLELHIVLIEWLFNNKCMHLSVSIWHILQIYHYIKKRVHSIGTKVSNSLPQGIKNLSGNSEPFKSALKNYLQAHSFYVIDKYFNVNKEWYAKLNHF